MKETSLVISLGCVDDELISGAADYKPSRISRLKYAAVAACAVLVMGIAARFTLPLLGTHAVDSQRTGSCFELSSVDELYELYGRELLISRLDLSGMTVKENNLYYDSDGAAENTKDWRNHILWASSAELDISVCTWFFGSLDSHKNDMLFTKENTKVYNINDVDVFVVPHPLGFLSERIYDHAIFEYDDIVYYISVQSNKPDMILDIVESMLEH